MAVRHAPRWLCCAAVSFLVGTAAAAWPPPPEEPAVLLHPRLPEVIEGDWLDRLELFPELEGLQSARFGRAPWGGLLVRLEVADPTEPGGLRVLVRNLSRDHWETLQERAEAILAGEAPPPPPTHPLDRPQPFGPASEADRESGAPLLHDPLAAIRSWPETPPPAAGLPGDLLLGMGPVPWRGRWLTVVDVGARINVTGFNTFFTPMGQIGIAFGHGIGARLVPLLGFYAGFGDMRRDFQNAFGDGRSNVFGFTAAVLLRQAVSDRQSLYVEGGGGYHMRSLYWDGIYYDPRANMYIRGLVREQQDWGWQLRAGWLRARDHATRPRLLDIGLGVQSSVAERWAFLGDDRLFMASGRDIWLVLSVRFWDGL